MNSKTRAFTLIEMLIVIAIISIMAAMAISNFSNAASDSRQVIARQQLTVVQEAVNAWAAHEIGRVTVAGGLPQTVSQVQSTYNATTNVTNRFNLFKGYLDESTQTSISKNNTAAKLTTDAMTQSGLYMQLPNWSNGSYPKVELH